MTKRTRNNKNNKTKPCRNERRTVVSGICTIVWRFETGISEQQKPEVIQEQR